MAAVATGSALGALRCARASLLIAICAVPVVGGCARHESDGGASSYGSIKDSSVSARPATKPARTIAKRAPVAAEIASGARKEPASVPATSPREQVLEAPSTAGPVAAAPASPKPAPFATTPGPAAAAPATPIVNGTTAAEREASGRLVAEGQQLFLDGKVVEARRRFIAALNGLSPEATLALARSFDTHYLYKLAKSDGAPDMQRAMQLYQSAVQRNAKDAQEDLDRVRATLGLQKQP